MPAGKKAWLGVLLFTSAFLAAGIIIPKNGFGGVTICSFRRMTGHGCPGCGMTRSVTSFLHGDPNHAIEMHLFGPVLVLVVAGYWIRAWVEFTRRVPRPFEFSGMGWTIGLSTFIVLYLAYWGVRMWTGTTP